MKQAPAAESNTQSNIMGSLDTLLDIEPELPIALASRASLHFTEGNIQQALADCDQLIEIDGNAYGPFLLRGSIRYWMLNDAAALADFNRSVELSNYNEDALICRGSLYFRQENYAQAFKDFSRVLKARPLDLHALKRCADISVYTGDLEAAKTYYKRLYETFMQYNDPFVAPNYLSGVEIPSASRGKLLSIFPESDELYYSIALYDYKLRDFESVWVMCDRALELNPKNYDALLYRGIAGVILERTDQAKRDLNLMIEKNPVNAFGYVCRGLLFSVQGEPGKAVGDFDTAVSLCDSIALFYNLRADALEETGQNTLALENHNRAVKISSGARFYIRERAFFYEKSGDLAEALEYYSSEISDQPNNYAHYLARGAYFQRTLEYQQALLDFTTAIELAGKDRVESAELQSLYCTRANLYKVMREYQKAEIDATMAIKLTEGQRDYPFILRGDIATAAKDHQQAIKDYALAIKLSPDYPASKFYHARALAYLGEYVQALRELDGIIAEYELSGSLHHLVYHYRAEVNIRLNRLQEAVCDLDEILSRNPTSQETIDWKKDIIERSSAQDLALKGLLEVEL